MNLYPYCFAYDEYNPNQPRDEKGRWIKTDLSAPIVIGGKRYTEEVIIKRTKENQRLYLHEVEIQERLEQFIQTSQTQDVNAPASKLIIAQKIKDYKPIRYGQDKYTCRLEIRTLLREVLSEDRK